MTVSETLEKYPLDFEIYVIKKMKIHWNSIRFDNTSVEPAKFIIAPKSVQTFYSMNTILLNSDTSKYNNYNKWIDEKNDSEYECFLTAEEAEIWKILELQELDTLVNTHIESIKKKAEKKIKSIKAKQNLDEYIQKYPELILKVM